MDNHNEDGGWKSICKRHWGKLLVLEIAAVFLLGYFVRGGPGTSTETDTAGETGGEYENEKPLFWTCSMHPEIQMLDNKRKCPKCQMDLIPVTSQSLKKRTGMRQLTVSPAARELMQIQTAPVERRLVVANVRMVGKVDYDETQLKHVTARVAGRLDRLFIDYTGVQVSLGDHMVSIYSEQLYTAQQELIEALKSRSGNQPQSDFFAPGIDLVESSREKLRLLGITEKQIAEIEKQTKPSDHMTFYSPMAGIVVKKMKQEGDRVSVGERIYTIADLTHLWVKLDAYESDLQWLRYGQKVSFTTEAYPGEVFSGQIAFIDPVLNAKTRTVKVRVNVENPAGKLKPEMFVRAVVESRVASGGRVMDAALAGKWISPMHPEIVKDEPGMCDRCGMPLVRAEALGYVPAEAGAATRPLVIPVSAALITGTRAIVYVEDTNAKEPTFNGREVVLGPRAGEFYLVRSGLREGEQVVTNGNFKIDSALQIQALPSMMTPEGGGGGGHDHGGHDHGGHASAKPASTDGHADHASPRLRLPVRFEDGLYDLLARADTVFETVPAGDLLAIRTAFGRLDEVVSAVDAAAIKDHPKMVWDELSMLIANDAVEGRDVGEMEDARRIAANLKRSVQRLLNQFPVDRSKRVHRYTVPAEFQSQLARLWKSYQSLSEALAADDVAKAKQSVSDLKASFASIDMQLLSESVTHDAWMREQRNLEKIIGVLEGSEDIKSLRESFSPLSGEMFVVVRSFGVGPESNVYQHYCSMAFGNRGAAWLQSDDKVRNPYFGATMFRCATRSELIAGGSPELRVQSPETEEGRSPELGAQSPETESREE